MYWHCLLSKDLLEERNEKWLSIQGAMNRRKTLIIELVLSRELPQTVNHVAQLDDNE